MLVGKLLLEAIDLLHLHPVGRRHLLEQRAAAPVAGREEDEVAADDRGGNDGSRLVDRIAPQELAAGGVDTDGAASGGLHIDLPVAHLRDHDRGVAGAAAILHRALPDLLAGLLVERDHHRVVAPRGDDESIAVDQRRLAVAPAIPLLAAEGGLEVDVKLLGAVGSLAADEHPLRRDHVNEIAVDRRRAAGALPRLRPLIPGLAGLRLPELLSRLPVVAGEVFVLVIAGGGEAVAEGVDPLACDRRGGVAAAGADRLPEELRAPFRPGFEEVRVGGHGGAGSAPERRPVFTPGRAGDERAADGEREERGEGKTGERTQHESGSGRWERMDGASKQQGLGTRRG